MDTNDFIKKALEDSQEEIRKTVVEKLKQDLINSYYWSLKDNIGKVVKEFFEEELADDIKKELMNNKELFLKEINAGIVESASAFAKKMVEVSETNLAGYAGKDIVKKLFG